MDFFTGDNINIKKERSSKIAQIIAGLPNEVQPLAKEAYQCGENGEFEKVTKLCQDILKADPDSTEIQMLLGQSYFEQDVMPMAQITFWDVVEANPEEEQPRLYLGLTFYAQENYKKAIEQFEILHSRESYQPDFLNAYADSLLKMDRQTEGCEILREEIAAWRAGRLPIGGEMLDQAFRSLLDLDITLHSQKFEEDTSWYYDYLNQMEMDDAGQRRTATALAYFCKNLTQKWYRPYFKQLADYIAEKKFLTMDNFLKTLESAYASLESYAYHEDHEIDALVEGYLSVIYDREYSGISSGEQKDNIEAAILNYEWFICQYYESHKSVFRHIQQTYPYTYELIRGSLEEITANPGLVARKTVEKLVPYAKGMNKQQVEQALVSAYKEVSRSAKEPVYLHEGEGSYKRMQPKVGRNDPCPCGSGKKYKKCCGR